MPWLDGLVALNDAVLRKVCAVRFSISLCQDWELIQDIGQLLGGKPVDMFGDDGINLGASVGALL
jgi:hypothetical protein